MKSDLSRRDSVAGSNADIFTGISANSLLKESPVKHGITQLEEDCKTEGPVSHCLQIRARFHFSYWSSILFCRKPEL